MTTVHIKTTMKYLAKYESHVINFYLTEPP